MKDAPESFAHLLAAWNERDLKKIRRHLDKALAKSIAFVDPANRVDGVAEFAKMVRAFRKQYPNAECVRTSGIDAHHDRARYSWSVIIDENTRIDGVDVAAFNRKSGKIRRIDGFFGPLPPA